MNSRDRIGILMDCARATGFPGRTGQFLEELKTYHTYQWGNAYGGQSDE